MSEHEISRWDDYGTKTENGHLVRYTDHVAALAAKREKVAEKFAAFADEKGEPRNCRR